MGTSKSEKHDRLSCDEKMHWLAINGLRVSLGPEPMRPWPSVHPTPGLLIGFYSKEERDRFRFALGCLSDANELLRFLRQFLPDRVRKGGLLVRAFEHPEVPTGFDVWTCESEDAA